MATVLERITPRVQKKPEAGTVHWFDECVTRGKREIFSELIVVSPGLANVILGNNPDNRNLRAAKIAQFSADMRAGRWTLNGEPIIVAKSGELNDGQHRLTAIIEANVSLPLIFQFGIDRDTRTTVDQGSARTAADYLGMEGTDNAAVCAGIARLVIAYERSGGQDVAQTKYVTNAEVLARVREDAEIGASARYAMMQRKHTKQFCAPSALGAAHYLLRQENKADADVFMDQVCVGESLRKNDPAFAVRERLWTTTKYAGQKLEVIFRGWNAYRAGRPLKLAKVNGNLPALV